LIKADSVELISDIIEERSSTCPDVACTSEIHSEQSSRQPRSRYREAMPGWESLRVDLRQLRAQSPGALMVFPDPESERREQRIHIELAAWATDIAATLNAKYGDLLDLRVGAMTFPTGELWVGGYELCGAPAESAGLDVETLSPLSVRTGRFVRTDVLVTNRAAHRQVLSTNGDLASAVIDSSGGVVGRYVGPHALALVGFPIEPQWWLVIVLPTDSGSTLSAPLEITSTP
jgi:hypothetical protein